MAQSVPESINFPQEEEKILKLWDELDVFHTCLKQSKGKPRYSFYDGPPFATGLPHYGHLLTGIIKDIVPRFAHQSGFHVERRFGWDCHGLPVEYEIDKTLGITGPDDVAALGIANYNAECRKIVMRYANEWEETVCRMGRWIDFRNDYKTMYPWFMETVWWVFKTLYEKGFVYKGVKVMPYSTTCNTPLSNFESGQNYKEVVDPAVIVSFPLDESPDVALIAWTTTPWTLPSNLALVVNPVKDYVKVKDNATEKLYIMMEARLDALFKKPEEYTIIERFKGELLKDKTYEPLFSYFAALKKKGAFRVLCDSYVTEESGTGVVHSAPFFGEDDHRVSLAGGIITKEQEMVCPVDASGFFTEEVVDFKHEYVKDADKNIIKWLKKHNKLVHQSTVKHSYPFCWRSDMPLIYKAVPSWFIQVEPIVDQLLENNQKTYWVPEFVKERRFANWLKDARDWAISRNRYFGTPIPLWISDDGQEIVCVGSIKELEELTSSTITDLHRESVDNLTIPSKTGRGVLKRVSEVFDCWFESGSMPYAQLHYPFENKKEFEDSFPADFIAEGIDQTRGWFYTLLVLSTALFGKPPFKNLVCSGLILASDGQKMSKRKKNYPDPVEVINKYGADALRLYLICSPAVRADSLRFKEEGVRDILKDVFLPWYNAYRFLMQNIERLEKEEGLQFKYNESSTKLSDNVMDRWIISFTQSLIVFVKDEMAAYRLYTVVPRLVKFVDNLTNWYVRVNRKRLKGENGKDDCVYALETLFGVLFTMIRMMASFTPFLTELMYQNLKHLVIAIDGDMKSNSSIHYLMLPQARTHLIDKQIEQSVLKMQAVIELGRVIRDRKTLPIKYPLPEVVVVHKDETALADLRCLEKYVMEELNVRVLTTTTDKEKYGVHLRAEPDHKTLGVRLKSAFKSVAAKIKELSDSDLQNFLQTKSMELEGHVIRPEEIRIMYSFSEEKAKGLAGVYEADSNGEILVLININPDQKMQDEGIAREVINRIQKLRKKAKLVPLDEVTLYYSVTPPSDNLSKVILDHTAFIENAIKSPLKGLPHAEEDDVVIAEKQQLKGILLNLVIVKGHSKQYDKSAISDQTGVNLKRNAIASLYGLRDMESRPLCRYVNIELCGTFAKEKHPSTKATILLENPIGLCFLDLHGLVKETQIVFDLQGREIKLYTAPNKTNEIHSKDISHLHGQTIYAYRRQDPDGSEFEAQMPVNSNPFCRFVNVKSGEHPNGIGATLLLENPQGRETLDVKTLQKQVNTVLSLPDIPIRICKAKDSTNEIQTTENLLAATGETIVIFMK